MIEQPSSRWEGHSAAELADRWCSPGVHLFESLGSTNDAARGLAAAGAPAGTVVLSDEQVAGRGRAGRSWSSPAGLGLWFSVIARPPSLRDSGPLPLLVGVAAARALDGFLPSGGAGLKWPNDILVAGRKLGGVLCESSWNGSGPGAVIAGVGLNLLHDPSDFPPGVREGATSLRIESPRPLARLAVADAVIPNVVRALAGDPHLDRSVLASLARRDVLRGHSISVTDPVTGRSLARGVADGIMPDGSLLVREESGEALRIRSGTVRRLD